ncbi:MAG: dihydroorotase, partial [Prochlorococcaceae cyanobacterium]
MTADLLLPRVWLLEGPDQPLKLAAVAIRAGALATITAPEPATGGDDALPLLAPCLVDAHSVLEDPLLGRAETLASLAAVAAAGGYGSVALLPWAHPWRDRPERVQLAWPEPQRLLLWGAFSDGGENRRLAPHGDQLAAGAIGLAGGGALPPVALLERGLQLGEMGQRPVLLAPRDPS